MSDERQIRMCLIAGDKFADRFMHNCDMFESFKILATPRFLTATLDGTKSEEAVMAVFADAAKKEFAVAAAFIVGTGIGYVDETVKLVSNGEVFCPLDVMLARCGYVREPELAGARP